jgi:wyosine [tRNA(Phe)-imidazoG37] synthetase (radical SAM superfamily)
MNFIELFINILKMIAFGPIPSRRLKRSLGINNIPSKTCSYSCIYCQLGKTLKMKSTRKEFYSVEKIFNTVKDKVVKAKYKGEQIDYLEINKKSLPGSLSPNSPKQGCGSTFSIK